MNLYNIPKEMRNTPNWILWRWGGVSDSKTGHRKKYPINPVTYGKLDITSSQFLKSFEVVKALYEAGKADGVGFVLTDTDPFMAFDIDNCINKDTGEITNTTRELVESIDSYAEFSPSGTGLHIYVKGTLPAEAPKRGRIEAYSAKHFMTVTGDVFHEAPIKPVTREQILKITGAKTAPTPVSYQGIGNDIPDEELLEKARNAKNGMLFSGLFDLGETEAHGGSDKSYSGADMALMCLLAYWTNKDAERMKRLFLQSALSKNLGRKSNLDDYLNRTINSALNRVKQGYTGGIPYQFDKVPWATYTHTAKGVIKPFNTDYRNLKALLDLCGVTVRLNVLTKNIELTGLIDDDGESLDGATLDTKEAIIMNIANINGLKLNERRTHIFIQAISDLNRYSPVTDYLERVYKDYKALKDKPDEIGKIWNSIKLNPNSIQDKAFCYTLFKKWLVSAVIMAFNDGTKTAQGVLVFCGGQGIGKTTFLYRLSPRNEWVTDGARLDPTNKDDILRALMFWLVELGEIGETVKKTRVDSLKQYITRPKDAIRPPYDRETKIFPRKTVFYGTVNTCEFLKDYTGDRRYWVIAVQDFKDIKINHDLLWGQVMYLARDKQLKPYLDTKELRLLAKQNSAYKYKTYEELKLEDDLDWTADKSLWRWYTAKEACNMLWLRDTNRKTMGRVLAGLAERGKIESKNPKNRRLYLLPPAFEVE